MKNLIIFSSLALVFVACGTEPSQKDGSVADMQSYQLTSNSTSPQNLDFESGFGDNGKPKFWSGWGPGYEITAEDQNVYQGHGAGQITAQKPVDFGTMTQCFDPTDFRGKRVMYSGNLNASKIHRGWGGLWMRVDGKEKKVLAFDNMQDRGLVGTIPWAKYNIVLDVSKEATKICFGFLLSGGHHGTLFADELSFSIVDTDTPTTGSAK